MDFEDGMDVDFGSDFDGGLDSSSFEAGPEGDFDPGFEEPSALDDKFHFEPDATSFEPESSPTETVEVELLEPETFDIEPGVTDSPPDLEPFDHLEPEPLEPDPLDSEGDVTDFDAELNSIEPHAEMEILEPESVDLDLNIEPEPIEVEPELAPIEDLEIESLEPESLEIEHEIVNLDPDLAPTENSEVESLEPDALDPDMELSLEPDNPLEMEVFPEPDFHPETEIAPEIAFPPDSELAPEVEPFEKVNVPASDAFETDLNSETGHIPTENLDVEPQEPETLNPDPELEPDGHSEADAIPTSDYQPETEMVPELVIQPDLEFAPDIETAPEGETQPEFEVPFEGEPNPGFENAPELEFAPDSEWSSERESAPEGEPDPALDAFPNTEGSPEMDFSPEDTSSLERETSSPEYEDIPASEPERLYPEGEPTSHEGMGEYPGVIGPEQTEIYHSPETSPETEPGFGPRPSWSVPPDTTDMPESEPGQSLNNENEEKQEINLLPEEFDSQEILENGDEQESNVSPKPGTEDASPDRTAEETELLEFEIEDWAEYPEGPRPEGPFRLLEGEEYENARDLANKTNRELHKEHPEWDGLQIHEIQPVKFGGSPTDLNNKIALTPEEHSEYTVWWNNHQRQMTKE